MGRHRPEFLVSSELNGNIVSLFRTYKGDRKYSYAIHWGENPANIVKIVTPKGNTRNLGGSIKEFFQAVEAAKHLTFSKK